jgi:hypothetical protein
MMTFCTLFDSGYLSRGLALYQSLEAHIGNDFHIYIFAFDERCWQILESLHLEHATIISQEALEDEELLRVKPTRTRAEYCWTCTSSTIYYVLTHFPVDCCTYVDADLFFFSSPKPLLEEMDNASVLITPHRYTPKYDQGAKTGIYCVQFVTIKNDERGLKIIQWWRKACLDWCYDRFENGKFGDQKYLDDWPTRFEGVHVLQHLGGGLAPWNMQQYSFEKKDARLWGKELSTGKTFEAIFFHFHSLAFVNANYFSPRPYYKRNDSVLLLVFNPYRKVILDIRRQYPAIATCERYLKGWKRMKYLLELFVRRGFKEIYNIKLLEQ